MNLSAFWRRLRRSAESDASADRVRDEMQFHIDMAIERNIAGGMTPEEARHAASRSFGDRTPLRDDADRELRHRWLENSLQDVRFAIRGMRRRALPATLIVLTLAIGLGAVTAVFSIVDGVLIKPLPYPGSDRLVMLEQSWSGRRPGPGSISPAEYFDYQDRNTTLDAMGAWQFGTADLTTPDRPIHITAAIASAGVLGALRVQPQLGRAITAADDKPGAASNVVLLSSALWRGRFGADRTVIGRSVPVDGTPLTVIGVLPDGFRLPAELGEATAADIMVPMALDRSAIRIRGSHNLTVVGRLRTGVSLARADAEVRGVLRDFAQRFPGDYPVQSAFQARITPLAESVLGGARSPVMLLLLAALSVLLIACANATGLMLAQGEARRREMALRRAIGAGTRRLLGQSLIESLVLACCAGVIGTGIAIVAVRWLVHQHPFNLPRLAYLSVDSRALLFTLVVTALAAVGFGIIPALRFAGLDLQAALRGGDRGASAGRRDRRARRTLITVELALAMVVLMCAGLLTRSFARLIAVDPGFAVDHAITAPISIGSTAYASDTAVTAVMNQLNAALREIPGVSAAGAVAGVPLTSSRGDLGIELEGHPIPKGQVHPRADWQVVTDGYLDAMGMRLVRGRFIDAHDVAGAVGVVVVNQSMAQKFWPGGDPIGKRFKLGGGAAPDTVTVIGVVADVHQAGLDVPPEAEMYFAHPQFRFWGGGGMLREVNFAVRTRDPRAAAVALRAAVERVAPSLSLGDVRTMIEVRRASVALPDFLMRLLLAIAAAAMITAVIGLYGLMSSAVTQRTREIGLRMALGAGTSDVSRLVTREGATVIMAGIIIGAPIAIGAGQLLRRYLFGVSPGDPVLVLALATVLAVVGLIATWVPAMRASRIDPVEALKGGGVGQSGLIHARHERRRESRRSWVLV